MPIVHETRYGINLLQQTPPECGGEVMGHMLFLFIGVGLIFYFLMIRPQKKEQQQRREMLASLSKKDKVVTAGGIYGTVRSVSDNTVTVIVDDGKGIAITFSKQAIRRRIEPGESKHDSEQDAAYD